MSNDRSNNRDHGRLGPRSRTGTARAVLGPTLAVVVGSVAWVGSIAGAGAETGECDETIEVYRLADPGSYSAFARSPSETTSLEVRGADGESLAVSPSTAANAAAFDLATAQRFDVPAPVVFEVDSHVDLHVDSADVPHDLVLVRFGDSDEWSGLDVHAPAIIDPAAREGCGPDGAGPLRTIRLDAAYSDVTARQVFVVSSHGRLDAQPAGPVVRP